ncbi:uncharacterized protein LOC132932745 [Metopolophium dirhodum]|uniref:uncharacterized protein LOC132932745 n=1 Tax=Metopolophium dirhodum TaxID=44670 RepID=UPI00298F97B0|nr:uncharacterized protein LOC132932745 [Metopolophium dirhodum]
MQDRSENVQGGGGSGNANTSPPTVNTAPPDVATVARLPAFWWHAPEHWFTHAEATFAFQRISANNTRVKHVLTVLDEEGIRTVADLLGSSATFVVLYLPFWFELSGKIPSVGVVGVELDILFSNFKQITEITITNILKDFDVAYPGFSDRLYQTLPLCKNKIFKLATEKINKSKDLSTNQLLKEYVQLSSEDNEEISNLAVSLCLPFLIGISISKGKKAKLQWRPSKVEMRDGFITHVLNSAEVKETISRRRDKLVRLGQTLQPFVLIVGSSLKEISNYFVIVDNTFYRLSSILSAVDCCFKIIITLNAKYPSESEAIWYFIQKGLYKLNTPLDKNFTAVNAFLSDVEITI